MSEYNYACDWCGAKFTEYPEDHYHDNARGAYIVEL